MADTKISALNELTVADPNDVIPIVDITAGETKKIQRTNLIFGYTLMGETQVTAPADATTYYLGMQGFGSGMTANYYKVYVPKAGIIKSAYLSFHCASTVGSNETSTVSLRINNTTDTTISSSVTNDSAHTLFSNTGLSISVSAGDYFELKWVTPTWATNPASSVILHWFVYIE